MNDVPKAGSLWTNRWLGNGKVSTFARRADSEIFGCFVSTEVAAQRENNLVLFAGFGRERLINCSRIVAVQIDHPSAEW